jgi:hypothetical protein
VKALLKSPRYLKSFLYQNDRVLILIGFLSGTCSITALAFFWIYRWSFNATLNWRVFLNPVHRAWSICALGQFRPMAPADSRGRDGSEGRHSRARCATAGDGVCHWVAVSTDRNWPLSVSGWVPSGKAKNAE